MTECLGGAAQGDNAMGMIGAILGFIVGLLAGGFALSLVFGSGRHVYLRERPTSMIHLGVLIIAVALTWGLGGPPTAGLSAARSPMGAGSALFPQI